MKRIHYYISIITLALLCAAPIWSDDAELRGIVDGVYAKWNQAIADKNMDGLMDILSKNFHALGSMAGRDHIKPVYKTMFDKYNQLRSTITVNSVKKVDSKIQVLGDVNLEYKNTGDSQWNTIIKDGFIEHFKQEGEAWKIVSSGQVNSKRFSKVNGNTYADKAIGFSFSVPEDWTLIPFELPTMKDGVMFMMPDGHAPGMFGHVQIPYNVGAKAAIEGDDAVMKKIMKTFKKEKSGPVTINGLEGYESLTRWTGKGADDEMTRHRIYLSGGGLLYVFILNTPTKHWDGISSELMNIVNTFTLSADAQKNGAARLREQSAGGEIMDRIYTNDEFGCQIAAPKGWTIQSTPLGSFKVSISMSPPNGKSLARLLATETHGVIALNDVFDQEMNGIKSITEDFSIQEEAHDIELAGTTARTATFTCTLEGLGTLRRKSVMLVKNDILYMILCDAIPPEKADELKDSFDAIIQSFTLN